MIPSIFREEKLKEAKGAGNAARLNAIKAAGIETRRCSASHRRSAPAGDT
jgi:hypothetical protein